MKNTLSITFSLAASILILSSQAFAQMSAADTLKEIAGKVKAARSPEPVVEYVDWNDLYKTMDEKAIAELKVTSAADLRDHFTRIFRDPGAYATDIINKQISEGPEDQRAAMREASRTMREALDKKTQEMRDSLGKTEFTIGKAEEKGDLAQVELISEREGQKSTDNVSMKKIGDKWYLTSPNLGVGQNAGGGTGGGNPDAGAENF